MKGSRLVLNAVEIEETTSALTEQTFDAQEFPFVFLVACEYKASTIKWLRSGSLKRSDCGDVLQTNYIHIKVYPKGKVEYVHRDLSIDLIAGLNPFGVACFILAKAMSEENLKQVAAVLGTEIKHRFGYPVAPRE